MKFRPKHNIGDLRRLRTYYGNNECPAIGPCDYDTLEHLDDGDLCIVIGCEIDNSEHLLGNADGFIYTCLHKSGAVRRFSQPYVKVR